MQKLISLLKHFVSGTIDADEFVRRYMEQWKMIRGEQDEAIRTEPGLFDAFRNLENELFEEVITKAEYQRRWKKLSENVNGCEVLPGTRMDEILSHLFVEADAYCGEAEFRDRYQIGEAELRVEVKKVVKESSHTDFNLSTP
jgi:hypothetical protein